MRGVGQIDAIESVTFKHAEGNEGKKNGVKRGNAGFFGGKLLKRQGRILFQVRRYTPNGNCDLGPRQKIPTIPPTVPATSQSS
jgi:hypothetical protein